MVRSVMVCGWREVMVAVVVVSMVFPLTFVLTVR